MEQVPNFEPKENREIVIDRLVDNLAEREGMAVEDILSDIITFFEIFKTDEYVKSYFEELAAKIGISVDEVLEYSSKKAEENNEQS